MEKSSIFHKPKGFHDFKEELIKRTTPEIYEKLMPSWQKARKSILVNDQWPTIINELKQNHSVYGLTSTNTGANEILESFEKWRIDEFHSKGIISVKQQNNELF